MDSTEIMRLLKIALNALELAYDWAGALSVDDMKDLDEASADTLARIDRSLFGIETAINKTIYDKPWEQSALHTRLSNVEMNLNNALSCLDATDDVRQLIGGADVRSSVSIINMAELLKGELMRGKIIDKDDLEREWTPDV